MFKVHDKVVYLRGNGIYEITERKMEDFGLGEKVYFTLTPISKLKNSKLLIAYVLESNAEQFLRPIMRKEEVLALIDSFDTFEILWYNDAKVRKQKYDEIYKSGDMKKICQIVKSVYLQNEENINGKKPISNSDREYLMKINNDIYDEFSIALDIPFEEVEEFITQRLKSEK